MIKSTPPRLTAFLPRFRVCPCRSSVCPCFAAFERKGHRRASSYGVPSRRVSLDRGPRARRGSGVVLADSQGFRGVLHGALVLPLPGAGEARRETQQFSSKNLVKCVVGSQQSNLAQRLVRVRWSIPRRCSRFSGCCTIFIFPRCCQHLVIFAPGHVCVVQQKRPSSLSRIYCFR